MFCAFEGRPAIVRLYGRGRVVEPGDPEWDGLIGRFPEYPGVRSVVVVDVERVADSCGFAVPLYEYKGERSQLVDWAEKKGPRASASTRPGRTGRASTGCPACRPPVMGESTIILRHRCLSRPDGLTSRGQLSYPRAAAMQKVNLGRSWPCSATTGARRSSAS